MVTKRLASAVALLGLGGLLAMGSATNGQQPLPNQPQTGQVQAGPQQQQGMDVLTTGPIHEAYAEPVDYSPKPTPVIAKQPPDPVPEIPPDQKPAGENVEWIPGYWFLDDGRNDYVWVSGIWRVPPPDQQWVPGYWTQAQGGWQWVPGFWTAVAQDQGQEGQIQLEYLPQPPEPLDAAPSTPQPDPNSVYVPGTWVYVREQSRYDWRPGYWVDYQPGWVWTPARYCWTPAGYVFGDGHWDYELERRGLMFAPIYFTERLWQRSSWRYQPSYCVYPDYLLSCLFVRPRAYCYYFGDYFSNTFVQQGFVPWIDFRRGRVGYDPLFSYYRWQHRDDRRWVNELRTVYDGRFRGQIPRPPRTLRDQLTLVNNVRNTNINITNINLVNAVAPLSRVNQTFVNLRPVTREEHTAHQQFAREILNESRERQQAGQRLVTSGTIPRRPNDRPQVARLSVPKSPVAARDAERAHLQGQPQTVAGTHGPERRPQAQPEVTQQPRPETRPEAKPQQNRPQYGRENYPTPQDQPRPETRPQQRPGQETRPPAQQPQPQPRPETRPQPQPQPRPETRPPMPAPQPEPRPAPQQPRPEARPEQRPQPQPQPQPRPEARPAPQPQPEARPAPQPQARPAPAPQPQARPAPAPQRPQPPPRPDRQPPKPPPQQHQPEKK